MLLVDVFFFRGDLEDSMYEGTDCGCARTPLFGGDAMFPVTLVSCGWRRFGALGAVPSCLCDALPKRPLGLLERLPFLLRVDFFDELRESCIVIG